MATKDIQTHDPMIDPLDGGIPGHWPGQTFKSVTAKIADIVLTPKLSLGWLAFWRLPARWPCCCWWR
jgi:hypothetical protein